LEMPARPRLTKKQGGSRTSAVSRPHPEERCEAARLEGSRPPHPSRRIIGAMLLRMRRI